MKRLKVIALVLSLSAVISACGIAGLGSKLNDIKGELVGNSFECQFYDNTGVLGLTASGEKIRMDSNVIKSSSVNSESGESQEIYTNSSVISIIIDGHEIETCGDTVIFEETGLSPEVNFKLEDIKSTADGIGDNTLIAGIVNKYKNYFGKSRVVVVKSQLGNPITAYSGDDVYYDVCDDLPKTTKVMIDGKALYIHRANFQIIDKQLID